MTALALWLASRVEGDALHHSLWQHKNHWRFRRSSYDLRCVVRVAKHAFKLIGRQSAGYLEVQE